MTKMSGCSDDGGSSQSHHKQLKLSVPKKKRNLPGTPDPDAEVVALSPETLMARNRFVCEICNKGFQRDQNLQLHRRGHNLPWKLKQRSSGTDTTRRKVYVCPETSCVHHDRARALGDLTGIKKHFSRKHGEKKWKCEKCLKKYAVHSDLKAHSKTCGSKEYKCDCASIFSRRDSFITHRAFCDALITEENNKKAEAEAEEAATTTIIMAGANSPNNSFHDDHQPAAALTVLLPHHLMPIPPTYYNKPCTFNHLISAGSMFSSSISDNNNNNNNNSALMSATALLQKAAQMGASLSAPSGNHPAACLSTSPIIQYKTGFITTMAPSSFGGLLMPTPYLMQKAGLQENISSSNGGAVDMELMIDDIPMSNGMFDQPLGEAARKTTTLDLLGAEGGKVRNFEAQESVGFGGLMENMTYFHHQGSY